MFLFVWFLQSFASATCPAGYFTNATNGCSPWTVVATAYYTANCEGVESVMSLIAGPVCYFGINTTVFCLNETHYFVVNHNSPACSANPENKNYTVRPPTPTNVCIAVCSAFPNGCANDVPLPFYQPPYGKIQCSKTSTAQLSEQIGYGSTRNGWVTKLTMFQNTMCEGDPGVQITNQKGAYWARDAVPSGVRTYYRTSCLNVDQNEQQRYWDINMSQPITVATRERNNICQIQPYSAVKIECKWTGAPLTYDVLHGIEKPTYLRPAFPLTTSELEKRNQNQVLNYGDIWLLIPPTAVACPITLQQHHAKHLLLDRITTLNNNLALAASVILGVIAVSALPTAPIVAGIALLSSANVIADYIENIQTNFRNDLYGSLDQATVGVQDDGTVSVDVPSSSCSLCVPSSNPNSQSHSFQLFNESESNTTNTTGGEPVNIGVSVFFSDQVIISLSLGNDRVRYVVLGFNQSFNDLNLSLNVTTLLQLQSIVDENKNNTKLSGGEKGLQASFPMLLFFLILAGMIMK